MKGGERKPYRPLHKTTQTGKRIPCTSGILRQVGVKKRFIWRISRMLDLMAGLAALELGIVSSHLGMAACTGMRAVQTMNCKKIAVIRTVSNIRLVVTYGTGDINLPVFRHDMMTGTTPQILMQLMPKTHMHLLALCVIDSNWVFNDFPCFI